MYGGACTYAYTKSLIDLKHIFLTNGIDFQWYSLNNESLVTRARNYVCDHFMRSNCTHLLFIDADIDFDPNYVLQLLIYADPESDKDVICGPYSKKSISYEKIYAAVNKGMVEKNNDDPNILEHFVGDFVINPIPGTTEVNIEEPFEVMESGTGFMMIQRKVFEKFAQAHPELYYKPDHVRSKDFNGDHKIVAYFMDPLSHLSNLDRIIECVNKANNIQYTKNGKITKEKVLEFLLQDDPNRHLSEDYYFCREIRKLGMKVWMCPWMILGHIGTYKFVGNLPAILSNNLSLTTDKKQMDKIRKGN